jgi:single-strand DNA-binding protein
MSRSLNKLLLIGNLGRDPEMKYTQQGTPVTTFSVAVSRTYQPPEGEPREETEWFRVVAWQKLAEVCNDYLHKGSRVYVEGRLRTREWLGQEGGPQKTMEVIASEVILLDGRSESAPVNAGREVEQCSVAGGALGVEADAEDPGF